MAMRRAAVARMLDERGVIHVDVSSSEDILVRSCVLLKGEFMSGEVTDDLFNPIIYPHWMWVLGVTLVVAVVGWVCFCLWRWWTSRIGEVMELQTISDARRKKYLSSSIRLRIATPTATWTLAACTWRWRDSCVRWARNAPGVTSRSQPCPRCVNSYLCGRGWRTCLRRVRPRALRARIFRLGAPRTRL